MVIITMSLYIKSNEPLSMIICVLLVVLLNTFFIKQINECPESGEIKIVECTILTNWKSLIPNCQCKN